MTALWGDLKYSLVGYAENTKTINDEKGAEAFAPAPLFAVR